METFFIKALQLIVALMLLVTVHEFGHYIFARIFGIKVNRFYLFFNPGFSLLKYFPSEGKLQIIAWTKKVDDREEPRALLTIKAGKPHSVVNKKGNPSWAATIYGLGWLPLGGYCDIAGMVDETKGADQLESQPQPWEFRSKGVFKRFCVMVAGVLFNFILAILIYAGIAFYWGDRAVPFDRIAEGMDYSQPLLNAGFQNGDMLLAINGERAGVGSTKQNWSMFQPGAKVMVLRNHTDSVTITIPSSTLEELAQLQSAPMEMRMPAIAEQVQAGPASRADMQEGDRIMKLGTDTIPSITEMRVALKKYADKATPMLVLRGDSLITLTITPSSEGLIGILLRPASSIYPYEEVHYNAFQALPRGWQLGTEQLTTYVSSLKLLFTKSGVQQVGGFGAIGNMFPSQWNWYAFWNIAAFLSVILAFMNIIPIPGLDGGHVLFLLWEMVTRHKPSDKVLEWANTIGFAFLILLLLYANGNDIIRAFLK